MYGIEIRELGVFDSDYIRCEMLLKKFLYYLNPKNLFKKSSEDSSLRMMHGVNKLSILLFLFCLVVMAYRYFR
jgi:hypothetical protein